VVSANSAQEEALLRLRDGYEARLASEREQHSTIYEAEKVAREAYERTRRELVGQALELGTIHMRNRAWEKAGLYLQRVVEIDPRNAKAYYSLGEIYFQLGRFELSKEMYKKAQEVY
jgi:Flp pilus assembly protein TadD